MTKPIQSDPIHAAIERHRAAWHKHREHVLNEAGTPKAEAEEKRLSHTITVAEEAMRATEPATIGGAVAFLRYVAGHEKTGLPLTCTFNAGLLADALAKIVGVQS